MNLNNFEFKQTKVRAYLPDELRNGNIMWGAVFVCKTLLTFGEFVCIAQVLQQTPRALLPPPTHVAQLMPTTEAACVVILSKRFSFSLDVQIKF